MTWWKKNALMQKAATAHTMVGEKEIVVKRASERARSIQSSQIAALQGRSQSRTNKEKTDESSVVAFALHCLPDSLFRLTLCLCKY